MKIEVAMILRKTVEVEEEDTQFADKNNPTDNEMDNLAIAINQADFFFNTLKNEDYEIISIENAETNEEIWVANEFEI